MSHQQQVYQWRDTTLEYLPHLSLTQAYVLTLWSFGMTLAHSCATSQLAAFWSEVLDKPYNTMRQRLREFYLDAPDKRGHKRHDLDVPLCFAPLLRWVLALWHGERLALAIDATTLGDRFVVLCVSVVYARCALPVAWRILPAQQKGSWRAEWLALLDALAPAVPRGMQTLVLADRGLYARWLYTHIVGLGWHPFLRVNVGGTFRPQGQTKYRKMASLCVPGGRWQGRGTAFQNEAQLACTLLACWQPGCRDPWLIVTDLGPGEADASWYRLRAWIEQGFKVLKSGGWQWQDTQMRHAERAQRVWLAMAIATLRTLALGEDVPVEEDDYPKRGSPVRAFRRGRYRVLARLLGAAFAYGGDLIPETWDKPPDKERLNTHRPSKQPPRARENLPQ